MGLCPLEKVLFIAPPPFVGRAGCWSGASLKNQSPSKAELAWAILVTAKGLLP